MSISSQKSIVLICRALLLLVIAVHLSLSWPGFTSDLRTSKEVNSVFITEGLIIHNLNPLKPTMFDDPNSPQYEAGAVDVPIYHYLIIFVESLLGTDNYLIGRAISTFFLILAIAFFYLLAEGLFGPIEAIIASFFLTLSPLTMLIGKLYQSEGMILFCIILSLYFLVLFTRENRFKFLMVALLLLIVAGAMKPFSLLYFAPVSVIVFQNRKALEKRQVAIFATVAVCCVCLLALWYVKRISFAPWGVGGRMAGWGENLKFSNFLGNLFFMLHYFMFGKKLLILLGISIVTIPFWKARLKYFFLAWLMALLFYFYYTATHISTHHYYHLQDLPFLCLLPAGLLYWVRDLVQKHSKVVKAIAITPVILAVIIASYFFLNHSLGVYKRVLQIDAKSKRSLNDAADYLTSVSNPAGDFVLIKMVDERDHHFRYRIPHASWYRRYLPLDVLNSFKKKGADYLVVFTYPDYIAPPENEKYLPSHLFKNYRLIDIGHDHLTFDLDAQPNSDFSGMRINPLNLDEAYQKIEYSNFLQFYFNTDNQNLSPGDNIRKEIWVAPIQNQTPPNFPIAFAVVKKSRDSYRLHINALPYFLLSEQWRPGWAYKIEIDNSIPKAAPKGKYEIMLGFFEPKWADLVKNKGYLKSIQDHTAKPEQFVQVGSFEVVP